MKEFVAKDKTDLVDFLLHLGFKRTKVKQLLKYRSVSVNDRPSEKHDTLLSPGDRVVISSEIQRRLELAPKSGLKILFEDDVLVIIEKPAGLLTMASEKEKRKTAYYQLNAWLRERNPAEKERIFIVHRLDRETSGLLVFAKTEAAKRRLQEDWHRAGKVYLAVLEGVPREQENTLTGYLNESGALKVYATGKTEGAKYAITKYRVLENTRDYSLVEVCIETGRKHQIRVHLSEIGHPVAGDKKYGARTNPLKRLALHAQRLSFHHPVTGKRMDFESRPPSEFFKIVKCGKYDNG